MPLFGVWGDDGLACDGFIIDVAMVYESNRINECRRDGQNDHPRDSAITILAVLNEIVDISSCAELKDKVNDPSIKIIDDFYIFDDVAVVVSDLNHHVDFIWINLSAGCCPAISHLLDNELLTSLSLSHKMDRAFIVALEGLDDSIIASEALWGWPKSARKYCCLIRTS